MVTLIIGTVSFMLGCSMQDACVVLMVAIVGGAAVDYCKRFVPTFR